MGLFVFEIEPQPDNNEFPLGTMSSLGSFMMDTLLSMTNGELNFMSATSYGATPLKSYKDHASLGKVNPCRGFLPYVTGMNYIFHRLS